MSKLTMVGAGYVGLTTAACLADLGNEVCVLDVDAGKVESLREGRVHFYEPGLQEVVARNVAARRLSFTTSYEAAVPGAEIAFIAVGTPEGANGEADLKQVEQAAAGIAEHLTGPMIVVNKSTVPIGTGDVVSDVIRRVNPAHRVAVVSNPEFLREGSALHDFMQPDRVVIGAHDADAAARVARLYEPLRAPVRIYSLYTAEMVKYASNAFLATRISFINEMARICERVDADVKLVSEGMGMDARIGRAFLEAGIGYGGSCLVGEETVLVRRRGPSQLMPLERLYAEHEDGEPCEVLSWRRDASTPEFLPVAAVTRRVVDDEIVEVRTKMGRRVRCTRDHPFVTAAGVKLAEDLTESDWLPLAQLSPPGTATAPLDLLTGLDAAALAPADVIVRPAAGVLTRGVTRTGTTVPPRTHAVATFWRVVGLYIAGGHVGFDGDRRAIEWSFHPGDEDDLAEEVRAFWSARGVEVTVRRLPTTTAVSTSSPPLAERWLGSLGLGARVDEQRIPDAIWEAPREHKLALLSGILRGDESWSLLNGGVEYRTVSRELADGMLRLLGDLGFVGSLRVGRAGASTRGTYRIRVSSVDRRIAPTGYRRGPAHAAWVRVTGLERRPFEGPVYSLEVPGAHTFVTTGGLVVHNCFPKDVKALAAIAARYDYHPELLHAVMDINRDQRVLAVDKLRECLGTVRGQSVALLGLAFKANTDDMREAPSLEIAAELRRRGAEVRAYDPAAMRRARELMPDIEYRCDAYAAADGADAVVVVTEWNEFRQLDLLRLKAALRRPVVVDGRNIYDPVRMRELGFVYRGIGRN